MLQSYEAYVEEVGRLICLLESELLPLLERFTALTGIKYERIAAEIRDAKQALVENRKVRLAVMGQVKTGKSTLLNALLFDGHPWLPTAATPKTARLTVISASGDANPPGAIVHFYSQEDWDDICREAEVEQREGAERIYADVKAEAERKLGLDKIRGLLGTTQRVTFGELEDYVAENGRFTPLVKFTELYYPEMPFDELEVVDTPGLNDPVRSRERQTIEYLRKADAVIFLSSPQRFLDREDMTLVLADMIRAGVDQVLVVVPQMDTLDPDQKTDFLGNCLCRMNERAARYAKESGFGPMAQDLAKRVFVPENTVMVSAMAYMLAKRLKRGERLTEDESWHLKELMPTNGWPAEDPDQLEIASNVRNLAARIEERIVARKGEILLRGPLTRLSANVNELAAQTERRLQETQADIQKISKNVERLKKEKEAELKEYKKFSDEVEKRLLEFGKEMVGGFDLSVPPIHRPQVKKTPILSGRKEKEANILAQEIVIEARRILREKSEELRREYNRRLEELRESLMDLLPTLSSQVMLSREVYAMLRTLFERLHAALDNTQIRANVSFSYSFWDKLFGEADAIACRDVDLACKNTEEEIEKALQNIVKECNRHISQEFERLRGKFQELYAEKRRKIDELDRGIVEGEVALERLEREYKEEESLLLDLKKVVDKVGPWFEDLKRRMSGGVRCSVG